MKGERVAKRLSLGSMMRKKLSDITNLQSQPKLRSQDDVQAEGTYTPDKGYIDQLLKERMTFLKLIAERNKVIEVSGAELQQLRARLQKLQLQNWNLAQSNSHMLTELNLGREKLKALQHELVCKDALLKAKNMEQRKMELNCKKTVTQVGEEGAEQSLLEANDDNKTRNLNRRRTTRSRSMGPSTTYQKVVEKEKVDNKRRCLRRQSARFKSHEKEPAEMLFEIEDAKYSVSQSLDNPIHEDGVPLNSSIRKGEDGEICMQRNEGQRSSIGRPLRKAVGKVQSYKEAPIKIKMRRAG
ncbi:SHUGOSHIN 2 isoform X1 [Alnus glutinosa]|uniref:SHUGOSHIN 2 isoform X1 n=1 Tax=Alnus glutinosa TaxID=3517 RepID=UPI002D77EE13|nr:SHUGOSHIN 2 isoform X1 [Alnus glutinosa]